jgi:transcriptional regulator with XRE-family HTH domain
MDLNEERRSVVKPVSLERRRAVRDAIGGRISRAITAQGISSAIVAERCGLTRPTVDRAREGENVQFDNLQAIAEVLDISLADLFDSL